MRPYQGNNREPGSLRTAIIPRESPLGTNRLSPSFRAAPRTGRAARKGSAPDAVIERRKTCLRGWQQTHAHTPGRLRQILIFGRKRDTAAHGKLEIAGIISAQPLASSQIEHGAQGEVRRLLVDHDRKSANKGDEFARARRGDAPVALADRKSVGQFQMPQRGDFGMLAFEPVQERAGCFRGLVVKAPSEGDPTRR